MKQSKFENQQERGDAQAPFGCGDGGCLTNLGFGSKGEKRGRHEGFLWEACIVENLMKRALEKAPLNRQNV